MSKATKLREYGARHRFWAGLAVKQTTFSNNILLTISIAVLGYFFVNRGVIYKVLVVDFALPIYWPAALFVVGTLLILFSILFGLFVSFTRLFDFRLTRHILLTRKRAMEGCYLLPDDELPEESLCQSFIGFFGIIFKFRKYRIKKAEVKIKNSGISDCNGPPFNLHPSKELIEKFNYLRSRSDSFGNLTHRLLIWQLLFFAFGLCFYGIVMVINEL
jgi:hypothetical protein